MAISRELPHSFAEALRVAREILSSSNELVSRGVVEAEAELLVAAAYREATGKSLARVELFARMGDRYPERAGERLIIWAGARTQGKILQHLTGLQHFLDHEYEVGPDVLVPRPETEVLATHALDTLRKEPVPPKVGLEIGIGSGVLSVELLAAFPGLEMVASELTPEAEARAVRNARRILGAGASRLRVVRAADPLTTLEPFSAIEGADFIISNPPYLTRQDAVETDVAQHEPATALFAPDADPLHFFRIVSSAARGVLRGGAWVFMELAHERADSVLSLFSAAAGWDARLVPDLTGRPRVLSARRK